MSWINNFYDTHPKWKAFLAMPKPIERKPVPPIPFKTLFKALGWLIVIIVGLMLIVGLIVITWPVLLYIIAFALVGWLLSEIIAEGIRKGRS